MINTNSNVVYTEPPVAIHNGFSLANISYDLTYVLGIGKRISSGAVTGGSYVEALSVAGRGVIFFAAASTLDASARTVSLRITIDGNQIFEGTSDSISAANTGIVGIGWANGSGNPSVAFQPTPFNSSALVEITQSLSETDKIEAIINYTVLQ